MQRLSEPSAMEKVLGVSPAAELEGLVDKLLKTFFDWLHPILSPDIAIDRRPSSLTSTLKCQLADTDSVSSIAKVTRRDVMISLGKLPYVVREPPRLKSSKRI